jgi:GNAT superfamily N-acetyltransferase
MDARHYFEYATLRDESRVVVRAITPGDKQNLREGLTRWSTDSVYMRFFRVIRRFSQSELEFLTEVDFVHHVALGVALLEGDDDHPLPIGVGRYVVNDLERDPHTAEVALAVDDNYQGIGVGTLLLEHLIRIARASGIVRFQAFLLPSNARMLRVLEKTGLPLQCETRDGMTEILLPLTPVAR